MARLSLGVLAALDSYAGFSELGMYLSTYDERMSEWQTRHDDFRRSVLAAQWEQEHPARQLSALPEPPVSPVASMTAPDLTTSDNGATKAARVASMLDIYRANPHAAASTVAQAVGVSARTVTRYLAELETAGTIHNNGGVKVLQ